MAFISSLLKPAKHEKLKTKKGEEGAEHQQVLKKKEDERKEKDRLHEHEEDSSEESESYSEEDSSDEENEQDRENDHLNENNKTWNSENNEEDEDDDEEENETEENERKEEVHKIYTSEEDDVSRRNSAHSNNDEYIKKKTKLSFNKKKMQSYFHKSYDKVSNAIIKTSKSFFKPHHHGDLKNAKEHNATSSNDILHCLESIEKDQTGDDSDFSNEDCRNIIKYLDKHINCEEKNEEIIKKFTTILENNDPKKVLEELQIILDERTLLLKSLNYFKILSINYKKQLNKSNNSYDILKSENEQLTENVKMLKKFIVSLDMTNTLPSQVNEHELKQRTCEFLKEPEKEQKEEHTNEEHTNEEHTNEEHTNEEHNEDNGGSTERNKGEYGSEELEPTSKEEETIKLNIIEEHDLNPDEIMYHKIENDNKKENENKRENENEKKNSTLDLKLEQQETLINNTDIIIRKEVVEEATTSS